MFAPKEAPKPAAPSAFPRLREAVTAWIEQQERSGEIRGATPSAFLSRQRVWVFPHALPDGRLLRDVPVDQVTREQIGAVILAAKHAGKSRSPQARRFRSAHRTGPDQLAPLVG